MRLSRHSYYGVGIFCILSLLMCRWAGHSDEADTNPQLTAQINDAITATQLVMDREIHKWKLRGAPNTVRALRLYKEAMTDVIREQLGKTLKAPLEAGKLAELKQGLQNFVTVPFEVSPQKNLGPEDIDTIEFNMGKVLELWKNEGRDLTMKLWQYGLQEHLTAWAAPDLTDAQKLQIKAQLTDLASAVEKRVHQLLPAVPANKLRATSRKMTQEALVEMNNPFSPEFKRPISLADWTSVVAKDFADVAPTVNDMIAAQKKPGGFVVETDYLYAVLWSSVIPAMSIPASPVPVADAAINKRWAAYQTKMFAPEERMFQQRLAHSFAAHQAYQDQAVTTALVENAFQLFPG